MIIIENVSFSYADHHGPEIGTYALRQSSLQVPDGAYIAFMGRNGSGKSTLARMINGLLLPNLGSITVNGLDTRDPISRRELRRLVQMVFQNPENQIVGLTVEDDIAFGLGNIGYPQPDMAARIEWALQQVGLDGRQQQPVFELSGGEKQKLALASVLALSPHYLILDETTSMLDPGAREQLLQTVHRIRGTEGFGLIHISHRFEEIRSADRLILFQGGTIVSDGTPEAALQDPALLAACGVELPYLAELSSRLRAGGVSLPVWPTEEELVDALCRCSLN